MADDCYPTTADWSCAFTPEEIAKLDPVKKARSELMAWTTLEALTAQAVQRCPVTIRPCAAGCAQSSFLVAPVSGGGILQPYIENGAWYNACGCRPTDCSCVRLSQIAMPGPIAEIVEVLQNGVVLAPSAYRVDNSEFLVRLDGEEWPACQDMSAPTTADNTLAVTFRQGAPIGDTLNYAAGMLASEYYKACTSGKCRLPSGVTSIVRQGVTMQMYANPFLDGLTGISEVDRIVAIYNPFGLRTPPQFVVPGAKKARVTTWPR